MFKLISIIGITLWIAGIVFAAPSSTDTDIERIVNGTDSDIARFPFMVSLRGSSGSHSCGASIISPNWVLTAAHCVNPNNPPTIYTIQHSTTVIGAQGPNIATISEIVQHPNYDDENQYIHDIALLRLSEPLTLTRYALLPNQFDDISQDTPAILTGWGLDQTGGYVQTTLQEVNLIIFSDEECRNRHFSPIHPSQICAGVPEGGRGQCSGDSGGPLMVNGIEVGLVSWSVKPCAVAPYPGVYTQVSYYRKWIQQITSV